MSIWWLIAALVVLLVLTKIPYRDLALRWVGNNAGRARVYVRNGDEVLPVLGKRLEARKVPRKVFSEAGPVTVGHDLVDPAAELNAGKGDARDRVEVYEYRYEGETRQLAVPQTYPVLFIDGHRMLGVVAGEWVACELPTGHGGGGHLSEAEEAALVRSGIAIQLVHSIVGPSRIGGLFPYLVAAAIGAGALYMLNRVNPGLLGGGA